MSGQLAFIAIPETAAQVLAARLELVRHALEDAASWRGELGDEDSCGAYQDLIDELDALEDDIAEFRGGMSENRQREDEER